MKLFRRDRIGAFDGDELLIRPTGPANPCQSTARGVHWFVDLGPAQEIIKSSDAIPTIAEGFDDKAMLAVAVRSAVIFRQQIDQQSIVLGSFTVEADRECNLARLAIEIMDEQDPIVAPVVTHEIGSA